MFCDAVAVVTLVTLQQDPARYGRALGRICTHSKAAAAMNDGSGTHPALATRLRVIAEVGALLEGHSMAVVKQRRDATSTQCG